MSALASFRDTLSCRRAQVTPNVALPVWAEGWFAAQVLLQFRAEHFGHKLQPASRKELFGHPSVRRVFHPERWPGLPVPVNAIVYVSLHSKDVLEP